MPRIGTLSRKTYFPKRGDMLENHTDGLCWLAKKVHSDFDEKKGEKVRYALLVSYHPDIEEGNAPIWDTVHDHEEPEYLSQIDVILRKKADGHVKYELNAVTGTWRQV